MKNIILVFLVLAAFISCEKEILVETTFESTGIIEGADLTFCPCCGGWILKIDNDTQIYRLDTLPENLEIEQDDFPVAVKFNSSVNRKCGDFIYLDIESIELN